MSASFHCHCEERKKPVKKRNWFVIDFRCNYSAFNGYHCTTSDYSSIQCRSCGAFGRTKAKYVDELSQGKFL